MATWQRRGLLAVLLVLVLVLPALAEGRVERLAEGVLTLGARGLREPASAGWPREQLVRVLLNGWLGELPRERLDPIPLGSLLVIDGRGYALTTDDLMERAERPVALGRDGEPRAVELIAADRDSNVALVRVSQVGALWPLPFAPARARAGLGDGLTVIGRDPSGRPQVLLRAVASTSAEYLHRQTPLAEGLLLLDGPVPAGWDGAAVVGEAGVVEAMALGWSRAGEVVGYAVPVKRLEEGLLPVLERLRLGGWLGARTVSAVSEDRSGARVEELSAGSPAEEAALKVGDLIVGWGERAVASALALELEGMEAKPGDEVTLSLLREGELNVVTARLAEHPTADAGELAGTRLGLSVQELTRDLAVALRVAGARGVAVVDVEPGGPAEEVGLRSGDVIVRLADRVTPTLEALGQVLEGSAGAVTVSVGIRRGPERLSGKIRLRPLPGPAGESGEAD